MPVPKRPALQIWSRNRHRQDALVSASGSRPTLQCSHCTYCSMNLKMLAWTCRQCLSQEPCKRYCYALIQRKMICFARICGFVKKMWRNFESSGKPASDPSHQSRMPAGNKTFRTNQQHLRLRHMYGVPNKYFEWTFSILSLSLSISILALALSSCPRKVTISNESEKKFWLLYWELQSEKNELEEIRSS